MSKDSSITVLGPSEPHIAIKDGNIKLPKIGLVKIKLSRTFTGKILNLVNNSVKFI